jgi:hypothetical protein
VTTHVEVVREGSDGGDLFLSLLIDDPDETEDADSAGSVAPNGPSPTGVEHFIEHVRAEVVSGLQQAR